MVRRPIKPIDMELTLVSSRRRCAICFGLHRNLMLKAGQIAHIDRDVSNNRFENLVFLCLEHHDQYDTTTRQSKGLTIIELRRFRTELYEALDGKFSAQHVLTATGPEVVMIDGSYIRIADGGGQNDSAEINISRIASRQQEYHVSGFALWGTRRDNGPNIGEFDRVMGLDNDRFTTAESHDPKSYRIDILVRGDRLIVEEHNWNGVYGLNVNFIGEYKKA